MFEFLGKSKYWSMKYQSANATLCLSCYCCYCMWLISVEMWNFTVYFLPQCLQLKFYHTIHCLAWIRLHELENIHVFIMFLYTTKVCIGNMQLENSLCQCNCRISSFFSIYKLNASRYEWRYEKTMREFCFKQFPLLHITILLALWICWKYQWNTGTVSLNYIAINLWIIYWFIDF